MSPDLVLLEERLATLIVNTAGDLHTQMQQMEGRINSRFDGIDARLDRQGGLLRSGQTNLVRLNDWSESVDKLIGDLAKRSGEIERRLERLEGGTN